MAGLMLCGAFQSPAEARDLTATIIQQLTRQGFVDVAQERTLLGRVRITATRNGGHREIIFNPNTGEILRDLWQPGVEDAEDIDLIDEAFVEDVEDVGKADDGDEGGDDKDGQDGDGKGGGKGGGGGGGDGED